MLRNRASQSRIYALQRRKNCFIKAHHSINLCKLHHKLLQSLDNNVNLLPIVLMYRMPGGVQK